MQVIFIQEVRISEATSPSEVVTAIKATDEILTPRIPAEAPMSSACTPRTCAGSPANQGTTPVGTNDMTVKKKKE